MCPTGVSKMVLCEHCDSKNSLDSTFCKGCGREISDQAREAAREENNRLIAEGYSMLGEGRTDEAELIAKSVLEADESVLGAWSLLGMVYERKGEWLGALECYERVLQKNPDSALDKIKVTQLKASLQKSMAPESQPNRKLALASAAAAVVFMGLVGVIVATTLTKPVAAQDNPAQKQMVNNNVPTQNIGDISGFQQPNAQAKNTQAQNENLDLNGGVPPIRNNQEQPESNLVASNQGSSNNFRGSRNFELPASRNGSLSSLPSTGRGNIPLPDDESSYRPVSVDPNALGLQARDENEPKPDRNEPQEDTNAQNNNSNNNVDENNQPEKKNRGVIVITPHQGGGNNGNSDENEVEVVLKTAREKRMTGQYAEAAKSYERARSLGRDNGQVNQSLGMIYEKLNRKSEALAAYQRALPKLEADVRAGKPGAKQALESTKQAIKNLNGG